MFWLRFCQRPANPLLTFARSRAIAFYTEADRGAGFRPNSFPPRLEFFMVQIAWRNQMLRAAALVLSAGLLSACAGPSALDELNGVQPTGSAFSQALYSNYSFLARSLSAQPSEDTGFFESVDPFAGSEDAETAAEVYATKALLAARGSEPPPEPAPDGEAQDLRNRLIAVLANASSRFPNEAARAQVDYDCWIINAAAGLMQASAQCRRSLDASLGRLENRQRPIAPPPVSAAPASDYTVYFDFDSWTLTAEALGKLQQAIDAARSGGQSRIAIVGHTDTSGDAGYNQRLSERRANVVRDVLVQMGARPESIQVSGVGESDLEVPTGDGVREPRNRRSVVTLSP
jgi:outer membrane protein OmpA-like peptidoglycan-associated protein